MELNNIRSSSDITSSRRECTRLLNQLKPVLRDVSRADCRCLLNSLDGNDFVDGGSILSSLFAIIRNEDDISTEGHRETSLELLRGLVGGAFRSYGEIDGDSNSIEQQNDNEEHTEALTVLFRHCAITFHQRMQRNDAINPDFHSNKGTLVEPAESSEHIRLLLVELLLDVSKYYLIYSSNESTNDKVILQSASEACQSLGKFALSDTYPEVQRASCSLIESLARLCPLAVRMNASLLLMPLAGDPESFRTLKSSLFRHRHTKTRCKAVEASAAIVLCCTKEVVIHNAPNNDVDTVYIESSISNDLRQHVGITNHGSKSASMIQLLNDSVLSSWEVLVKLDSAASVREAVLRAAGQVSHAMEWNFSPSNYVETQLDTKDSITTSPIADLESSIETRLLLLFMMGISDGNAQVRGLAVQQLSEFHQSNQSFPWDTITKYFQSMLEHVLDECSSQKNLQCQSKVRSIETLQVLLSLGRFKIEDSKIFESVVQSMVDTLSNGILSDEKDVLEASLKACRVIGSNDSLALNVLWHVFHLHHNQDTKDMGTDETTEETAAVATPRQLASNLLLLDGLMKGHLANQEVTTIFKEIDSSAPISRPDWFHQVYGAESLYVVCQVLSSRHVLRNVTSNSSLAWALLDAVQSFVSCINQPLRIDSSPSANITAICILTCITYLLGCPEEFDIPTDNVMTILKELNSPDKLAHPALNDSRSTSLSLLDIYFRHIAMKITKSEPFPWKRSDPAFLAMDALLRNAKGSTVRNNFELVEPLFIHHLPLNTDNVRDNDIVAADQDEQYSTRIWIMSLLQAVLSDATFSEGSSDQITFDRISAVLLVNLIWKSGTYAAALRKMSAAALFSLLHRCSDCICGMEYETVKFLLPILQSNLDDVESSTREMSCLCLQLVLKHMSHLTFQELWSNDTRVIDSIHPHLLSLLDDSHDPVRLASIMTIDCFLNIAITSQNDSGGDSCFLCHSALECIAESLVLAMDDSQSDIQYHAFIVLSSFVELVQQHDEIIGIIQRHVTNGLNTHRDGEYCKSLLILCEKEL
eukprot:scaffold9429_cov71-Cyclotella_meneghiniana.AAC.2